MKIYSVKDVCGELQVGRIAIIKAIHDQRLRASKISGQWRITEQALMDYLKENENIHAEN